MESIALKKLDTQLKWHQRIIQRVHFNGQQLAQGGCLAVGWLSCSCQCPKEPSWRAPEGGHLTLCAVYVPTRPKDGCWKVSYSAKYHTTSVQGVTWMSSLPLWFNLCPCENTCLPAIELQQNLLLTWVSFLKILLFSDWQLLYFVIFSVLWEMLIAWTKFLFVICSSSVQNTKCIDELKI